METGKRKSYQSLKHEKAGHQGFLFVSCTGAQSSQKGSLMAPWFLGGRRNAVPGQRWHSVQTGCPGLDLSAPRSQKAFIQCPGAGKYSLFSAIRWPSDWKEIPSFQKYPSKASPHLHRNLFLCRHAHHQPPTDPPGSWHHPWFSLSINIHSQPTLRPPCEHHISNHPLLFISM